MFLHTIHGFRITTQRVQKLYRSRAMARFVSLNNPRETSEFNYKDAAPTDLPSAPSISLGSLDNANVDGATANTPTLVNFKRGTQIQVRVVSFGPLGASVTINEGVAFGMILQGEIALYRDQTGNDPKVGDRLTAYVQRVRPDQRVNVSLRRLDKSRIGSVAEQVLEALEGSPTEEIPVGDKSAPEDIASYFYGKSHPPPLFHVFYGDDDDVSYIYFD